MHVTSLSMEALLLASMMSDSTIAWLVPVGTDFKPIEPISPN